MNMGAFVGVAKGSVEEPYLLEMKYSGGLENQSCVALVGKGKWNVYCINIIIYLAQVTYNQVQPLIASQLLAS